MHRYKYINLMDPRVSELHITNSKSVKEYAYFEDKNFPTRKNMEDSIYDPMQITLLKMISVIMAVGCSLSLMVMGVQRFQSSVPALFQTFLYLYAAFLAGVRKK